MVAEESALLWRSEGQYAQPSAFGFNGEESACFQLGLGKTQRRDRLRGDALWAHIHTSDLHDAGLLSMRDGEDRAEVQVVGDHDAIVDRGISEDFQITCVGFANFRPMYGLPSRIGQRGHPTGRQVHINKEFHARGRVTSRSSARQAA